MIEILPIIVVLAIGGVVVSLWLVRRLLKEVNHLKRKDYYVEQKLNGIAKQISEAVDPLRLQVAALAAGHSVPDQLIRSGRLYENVSAEDAERLIEQKLKARCRSHTDCGCSNSEGIFGTTYSWERNLSLLRNWSCDIMGKSPFRLRKCWSTVIWETEAGLPAIT